MKVRFTDIVWDTDDDATEVTPGITVIIPVQVELPSELTLDTDLENEEDVQYRGADVLSDHTGWCVESFNYEILDN